MNDFKERIAAELIAVRTAPWPIPTPRTTCWCASTHR